MKILNFGSLNIDKVYDVAHIVRPGETITSAGYNEFCGGKGLNQSIALAAAGAKVLHAGKVGPDGEFLLTRLAVAGVDASLVKNTPNPTGHAIIQVNQEGENSIVLFGGANREITTQDVGETLDELEAEDFLMLQNEISAMPEILRQAEEKNLNVVFNPAPMTPEVLDYPLGGVKYFVVNETEGESFTNESEPEKILDAFLEKFPNAAVLLTLGKDGVHYADNKQRLFVPAENVTAVDTTAAGDTFLGYFVAMLTAGKEVETCLRIATKAAAICVTRAGAADAIPMLEEVEK